MPRQLHSSSSSRGANSLPGSHAAPDPTGLPDLLCLPGVFSSRSPSHPQEQSEAWRNCRNPRSVWPQEWCTRAYALMQPGIPQHSALLQPCPCLLTLQTAEPRSHQPCLLPDPAAKHCGGARGWPREQAPQALPCRLSAASCPAPGQAHGSRGAKRALAAQLEAKTCLHTALMSCLRLPTAKPHSTPGSAGIAAFCLPPKATLVHTRKGQNSHRNTNISSINFT